MPKAGYLHDVQPGVAYTFTFTNYKNARAERRVVVRSLQWGGTTWHPELQWFIYGLDLDKLEPRSFPLAEIELNTFRRMTDEEIDVYFTKKAQAADAEGYNRGIADAARQVEEGLKEQ